MSPSLSLVVRSFNEERHLGRLLEGLAKQTLACEDVVVVDSGSDDRTVAIAEAHGARVVHLPREEFSFGRSLNAGVEAARGDLVVIASAHVYPVFDTWLERLIAPLQEDDRVAVAYGRQEGTPHSNYAERRIFETWFPPTSVARQDHPFCNNANAAIRRSVWQESRYDESLTGLEDLDWAKRAMNQGWFVSYRADAPVVHVHHETARQIVNRYRREAIAHKAIYGDQRISLATSARLAVANVAADYVHAVRDGALLSNLAAIPKFRVSQFLGAYRGFRHHGPVSKALRERFYYPGPAPPGAPLPDEIGLRIDYEEPTGDAHVSTR